MKSIIDNKSLTRALSTSIDPLLKRLLMERRDQLGGDIVDLARFLVVQPGDDLDALETELGFPVRDDLEASFGCEWVVDHGSFYEAVWILIDDGFAHVAFVPKQGVNPDLLRLCELYVTDPV